MSLKNPLQTQLGVMLLPVGSLSAACTRFSLVDCKTAPSSISPIAVMAAVLSKPCCKRCVTQEAHIYQRSTYQAAGFCIHNG
jgi:hypothetical protein